MVHRDFKRLERRRLRAAPLFEAGLPQAEVARRLGVSRPTALRWALAWESGGREALRGAGRAGRKPRLSAEQIEEVEEALLRGPLTWGYETELWTLPRIARVIRRVTGVEYHPGHVWRVLKKLGWSRQKPTTRARERDEVAIARWVRVSWPAIKKTPHAKARRSSSSTRRASRSVPRFGGPGHRGDKRRS